MSNDLNLNLFADKFQQYIEKNFKEGIKVDENTFAENICNDLSIFKQLDMNGDGEISPDEFQMTCDLDSDQDGVVTKDERRDAAMSGAKYFAKRNIDKWFTLDINRDGYWSNVEERLGDYRMFGDKPQTDTSLYATKTNEELAKIFNLEESIDANGYNIDKWMDSWSNNIKDTIQSQYGYELSDAEMIQIKKEMIKQLNTWLLKTGDNATQDAPLYQSCNNTAYTRLITGEQTVSCCGGDVSKPPMGPQDPNQGCVKIFSSMEGENAANSASEVKNRLAWAMFKCKTPEEVQSMSRMEYQEYQEDWQNVRNMTAADFRELLKPENERQRARFERNSQMSVAQIVQYIDIVESVIGEGKFDSNDWSIDSQQFQIIGEKVNGTYGDDTRLEGKTRADIPENRQDLLRFLEEKGWLYEQFK